MTATLLDPAAATPAATDAPVLVRPPASGEAMAALGNDIEVRLATADTAGAFSLLLYSAAPNGGPPPHRHRAEAETFITIDEGFAFLAGDQWVDVPAHTVVHIPAGARHTFRNTRDEPARCWVMTHPGGLEDFLRDFAEVANAAARAGQAPDPARMMAVWEAHGVEAAP